jgi:hypothetical protein
MSRATPDIRSAPIRARVAAWLAAGAGVALAVALVPAITGAHRVTLGSWALPVREIWRPLAAAALLLGVRAVIAGRGRAAIETGGPARPGLGALSTVVLAGGVASAVFLWFHLHVPFCGGLDSYGYVSAAHAIAAANLVQPQAMLDWLPFERAIDAATPLAWVAAPSGLAIVPAYPLGFPVVMAAAILLAGPGAAFYVPLLAAAGIVALAFVAARRAAGPLAGAAAAIVVAWNPVLVNMAVQPMSDVPAAFWYLLAVTCLLGPRTRPAFAGLAFGMSVWTRPLVLALAPALIILLPRRRRAVVEFVAGGVPVALAMAGMQWLMYGSPFRTGYGGTDGLFTTANVGRHLFAYARWTFALHGPIFAAAFAAGLWRAPRRLALSAVVGLATGTIPYLFNLQYFDDWDLVRYILPALVPCVIVAVLGAVSVVQQWLPKRAAVIGVLILSAAAAAGSFRVLAGKSTWQLYRQESRYQAVAEWFVQRTPENAVVFADLHSGSLRFYAGRSTLRWVRMPPGSLAATVDAARKRGLPCYAVFDDEREARSFGQQAAGESPALRLDAEASVRLATIHRVSIEPGPGAPPAPGG